MSEYTEQAEKFLVDTGTAFTIEFLRKAKYFIDDKDSRDIYRFTLSNDRGSYSSEFGDSIYNSERRAWAWDRGTCPKEFRNLDSRSNKALRAKVQWRKHKPAVYDILASLEKYEVEPLFKSWVYEFGYNDAPWIQHQKIREIHDSCIRQYQELRHIFTPEQMEMLQGIN